MPLVLAFAMLATSAIGPAPSTPGPEAMVSVRAWLPQTRAATAVEGPRGEDSGRDAIAMDAAGADLATMPAPGRSIRRGTASTYGPGWPGWIAWPDGPGWRLKVCGPGGCAVVVTTDSGPDLAMQRAGRIVDLDVATFEHVAGASWTTGLTRVTVTVLGKVAVARVVDPES